MAADAESERYQHALRAVLRHPWWRPERLAPPCVLYDPAADDVCYLFHLRRQRLIFVVSPHPVPVLEAWARGPKVVA